jgi:hypothetical protein
MLFVSGEEVFATPVDTSKCDISSLEGAEKRRMAAVFVVPDDLKPGSYDLYLRFSAPLKDEAVGAVPRRPIRFANADMWNDELKANAFGKVEVR